MLDLEKRTIFENEIAELREKLSKRQKKEFTKEETLKLV